MSSVGVRSLPPCMYPKPSSTPSTLLSCSFACSPTSEEFGTGQDRTGQDRTGQDRRQDRTGQDRTGQDRTGQDRTGQDRTGQDRTGAAQVNLYCDVSSHVRDLLQSSRLFVQMPHLLLQLPDPLPRLSQLQLLLLQQLR
eukprot:762931-Hanusia_phi.AAC.7